MDKKTTGIIATVATVLLCGCPGLFGLCLGAYYVLASFYTDAQIDYIWPLYTQTALSWGLAILCLGLIFIAIPIVVGVLTLRNKSEAAAPVSIPEEPLPPPS